jgi:predicted HD phosphohydrolase
MNLEGDNPMNARASFTHMQDSTQADWQAIGGEFMRFSKALPDRVLAHLRILDGDYGGFPVDRLTHSLQTATRALRDGRDEEYVVAALLHDIGDELAPHTHGEMVAAVLKPYVRPELCWVVKHHGLFQMYYYAHHSGGDRNARDRYRDHEWYDACAEFCEKYDQNCFDPAYDSLPVSEFEPMVRRVFGEVRYLDGE